MKRLLPILLLAIACGPKTIRTPEFEKINPRKVAFLGVESAEDIRPERKLYLTQTLRSAIESRGFLLLDDKRVRQICPALPCSNAADIVKKFNVDGLVYLRDASVNRNNFGIGYWNVLSGNLVFTKGDGTEYLRIEHTEQERGGVLFQSGQVIQGLIDTAANAGDDAYNRLADKFVRTLALQMPLIQADNPAGENNASRMKISRIETKRIAPEVHQICADTPPGTIVTLTVKSTRTNLREISPGHFCGIYHLPEGLTKDSRLALEARTPYGDVERRQVTLEMPLERGLENRVWLESKKQKNTLSLKCVKLGRNSSPCKPGENICAISRALVFKAPSESGPFERVTDLKSTTWTDPRSAGSPAIYRVAVESSPGVLSKAIKPVVNQ